MEWIVTLNVLSVLFAALVIGVGAVVLVYASGYFTGRGELARFVPILLLFMVSMLGVVVSDNLLMLFVFWELTRRAVRSPPPASRQ